MKRTLPVLMPPGGPANLSNFNTGNALLTLVVPDVPSGTYLRVRADSSCGTSHPTRC
jgi:hypothetical protein